MMSNKLTYKKKLLILNIDYLNRNHHQILLLNWNRTLNALLGQNAGLQKYHCRPLGRQPKIISMNICM